MEMIPRLNFFSCEPLSHSIISMDAFGTSKRRRRRRILPALTTTSKSDVDSSSSSSRISTIDDLTDDELIEILVRLPVKSVHRFRSVSKHWLSLISDPFFRSYFTKHPSNTPRHDDSFLIFYAHEDENDEIGSLKVLPLSSEDIDNNIVSNKDHVSPSLVTTTSTTGVAKNLLLFPLCLDYIPALNGKPAHFLLHTVCKELMLLDLTDYSEAPDDQLGPLVVCNPITKQWMQLPPLNLPGPMDSRTYPTIGFTCHAKDEEGQGHEVGFTVVHLGNYKNGLFEMHVFSTETINKDIGWTTFLVRWSSESEFEDSGCKMAASMDRVFYWQGGDYIVAYDAANKPNECDVIKTPPHLSDGNYNLEFDILPSQGGRPLRLYSKYMERQGIFSVWELVDYNKHVWSLKYHINIPNFYIHRQSISETNADKVYLLVGQDGVQTVVVLDLRKGTLDDILRMPPMKEGGMMLDEMVLFVRSSWPTSFHGGWRTPAHHM